MRRLSRVLNPRVAILVLFLVVVPGGILLHSAEYLFYRPPADHTMVVAIPPNVKDSQMSMGDYLLKYTQLCKSQSRPTLLEWNQPLCPCLPRNYTGWFDVASWYNQLEGHPRSHLSSDIYQWTELQNTQPLDPGGHWKPTLCRARQRVAIIIPFRNRDEHLQVFVKYMHPFLQSQLLDYTIFVIEQGSPDLFNRAALMNIGFLEANKLKPEGFDCYIFHDVDLLPEDDRNMYTCYMSPLHLGAYMNKFHYEEKSEHDYIIAKELLEELGLPEAGDKAQPPVQEVEWLGILINAESQTLTIPQSKIGEALEQVNICLTRRFLMKKTTEEPSGMPYAKFFGGAIGLSRSHIMKINGFSNHYYGWGGEDDDTYNRVLLRNLSINRYPQVVGRSYMIEHNTDEDNPKNPLRDRGYNVMSEEYDRTGLCSIKYTQDKVKQTPQYTKITVSIEREFDNKCIVDKRLPPTMPGNYINCITRKNFNEGTSECCTSYLSSEIYCCATAIRHRWMLKLVNAGSIFLLMTLIVIKLWRKRKLLFNSISNSKVFIAVKS